MVVLWVKLREAGYTRSVTSLYRMMIKLGIYNKAPSKKKKYEPKDYVQMTYPGQRVQVDVKYVPSSCMTKELKEKGIRHKLIKPYTPRHNGKRPLGWLSPKEKYLEYING